MYKNYTNDELIADLYRFKKENGRDPQYKDMTNYNGYISKNYYIDRFKTWNNALIAAGLYNNYTNDDLKQSIELFIINNNKMPTVQNMLIRDGYISSHIYINKFGSWNNALIQLGFKINKTNTNLTNKKKCELCNANLVKGSRYYKNNLTICANCYKYDRKYFKGILNPNSNVGVGIIAEYVVSKTLNDCIKCNILNTFTAQYDLISDNYKTINVKSSLLKPKGKNSNHWKFDKKKNAKIPHNYICIGFDTDRTNILKVWIIPNDSNLITQYGISITNTKRGLKRAEQYEIDATPYDEVYKNLDIYSLEEFCNFNNNVEGVTAC